MHEQNFKDLLSSTWPVSLERIVLDLESEVYYRPGFNTHWGYHFATGKFCFHVVKPLMPKLALLQTLCIMGKLACHRMMIPIFLSRWTRKKLGTGRECLVKFCPIRKLHSNLIESHRDGRERRERRWNCQDDL